VHIDLVIPTARNNIRPIFLFEIVYTERKSSR